MMGPQKSLSELTDDVRVQTSAVNDFVHRLRAANRRLTGSTGEQPTQLAQAAARNEVDEMPPLMVGMTIAIEHLNSAMSDLRAEISYMERLSETADHGEVSAKAPYAPGAGTLRAGF
jgi:hypothetical protein